MRLKRDSIQDGNVCIVKRKVTDSFSEVDLKQGRDPTKEQTEN